MTDYGGKTLQEKMTFLKRVNIFSETGEDFLSFIATALHGIQAKPQQVVFRKGDPGDAMYIITSGSVRVHDGNHVLSHLTVNDVFGEYALIDDGARSASVTAEEASYFLVLNRSDFEDMMASNPGLTTGILKVLISRMRDMNALEEKLAKSYIKIQKQNTAIEKQHLSLKETKQKLEEQNFELLTLNEEKNHLISTVVHGLKNPLTSSLSMIDLVMNDPEHPCEEHRQYAEIIHTSLLRMNKMINQVLDINVIESKVYNLKTEKINLKKTVEMICDFYKLTIQQKELAVELSLDDMHAELNEVYILQIIDNLISNAIKYTPKGKSIFISLLTENGYARLMVRDTGVGIPKSDLPGIFDQYQRQKHHLQQLEPETGLGLAIVKKYVEAMNGKVWCESEPGQGASFFVEFPSLY
jgi:signal transduction histidine kinase